MLRTWYHAQSFEQTHRETNLAVRAARPTAAASPIATKLRAIAGAWRESLAACRQYEQLRSSGIPHETAVREALGIGPVSSQAPRESTKPLYVAGKA